MQESMTLAPIQNAKRIDIPLLLAHGGGDISVEVTQSQLLKEKLEEFGHPVECTEIEGATHEMNKEGERLKLFTELARFLSENTQ